ncbi:ABC transporter permease, partial [Ammonifex thiophilus]|uniref:ABC transporter permease subunit n=1 Tax=Ammonifex thiophilus TaxID=444093 RepID=UPI001402C52B
MGTLAARHRRGRLDRVLLLSLIGFSEIPSFLLGLFLLLLFAVELGWFPLAGAMTPFKEYRGWWEAAIDVLHHACLPLLALTLVRLTGVFLLTRNTLLLVANKDFIRTARAKGIGERRVWYRHALR